jgi:hypothetical protein
MRRTRLTGCCGVVALLSAACLLVPPAAAGSSGTSQPPFEVTFDSTMVNQFAGLDNGPSGSETTEIQATIPLTNGGSGAYTGSASATYAQATGTITETCSANGTTGTTTETELSGNPTTFSASYTPGANNVGGSLVLDLGPFTGGLSESFQDTPGCGGFPVGNTTPRFLADFVADHLSEMTMSLTSPGDQVFTFTLTPGGSLGGPTSYAGTYDFSGGSTAENLTYTETTSISVFAHNCVVPSVAGMTLADAESALTGADCTVGAISKKSSTAAVGTVISSNPAAGTKLDEGGAVALVISGKKVKRSCQVPKVKGKKLATAEASILKGGCTVGRVTHTKVTKKKLDGQVVAQSPSAGKKESAGTKVNLTVGKFTASCKVPKVKGKTLATAVASILKAGCTLGRVSVTKVTDPKKHGQVLAQSPSAGTTEPAGTKVDLRVGM